MTELTNLARPVGCRPQITSLPVPESLMVATPSGNASNFHNPFDEITEQT
jgi:hypothetical protein